MGDLERSVENYLHDRVTEIGGTTYKWVSPGRANVPDRIVIVKGHVAFVEVKTETGKLTSGQQREIDRLRDDHDVFACVVYGKPGVEIFIEDMLDVIEGK